MSDIYSSLSDIPDDELEIYLMALDAIQESGVINMFGAAPHLRERYPELTEEGSRQVHKHWMTTYGDRHPKS